MTEPLPGGPLSTAERAAERFTDGEWHRLHPATPLLRGGIVFIAVLGFVLSNLRERLVGLFVGAPDYGGDPLDEIYNRGWEGWALLGVAVTRGDRQSGDGRLARRPLAARPRNPAAFGARSAGGAGGQAR